MTKMRPTEVKLNNAPEDLISTVRFGPKSNQYLIASSWDGTVRFYDVVNNAVRQKFVQEAPVLDVTFMVSIKNLYEIQSHNFKFVYKGCCPCG